MVQIITGSQLMFSIERISLVPVLCKVLLYHYEWIFHVWSHCSQKLLSLSMWLEKMAWIDINHKTCLLCIMPIYLASLLPHNHTINHIIIFINDIKKNVILYILFYLQDEIFMDFRNILSIQLWISHTYTMWKYTCENCLDDHFVKY